MEGCPFIWGHQGTPGPDASTFAPRGGGAPGPQESLEVPDSVQIVQHKPTDHCVHTRACPATVPRAANVGLRGQAHDDGRSLTTNSWGQVEQVERDS